jgi:hypothetical protein
MPGGDPPRLLDAGDGLSLVVGDVPLALYGERELEGRLQDLDWVSAAAIAHEALVEHFSREGTVIPVKLFTMFRNDARALAYVQDNRKQIDAVLERISGCSEWGIRVSFDEAGKEQRQAAAPAAMSGIAFLRHKRDLQQRREERAKNAPRAVQAIFNGMAKVASEAHRREADPNHPELSRLLLDATYLVPTSRTARFRARARQLARQFAPRGYRVTLTGPWPPYNFIEDR